MKKFIIILFYLHEGVCELLTAIMKIEIYKMLEAARNIPR